MPGEPPAAALTPQHNRSRGSPPPTVCMVLHGIGPRLQVLHHLGRQRAKEAAASGGRDVCT